MASSAKTASGCSAVSSRGVDVFGDGSLVSKNRSERRLKNISNTTPMALPLAARSPDAAKRNPGACAKRKGHPAIRCASYGLPASFTPGFSLKVVSSKHDPLSPPAKYAVIHCLTVSGYLCDTQNLFNAHR